MSSPRMTDTAAATCASGSTRRDAVVMSSCVSSSIESRLRFCASCGSACWARAETLARQNTTRGKDTRQTGIVAELVRTFRTCSGGFPSFSGCAQDAAELGIGPEPFQDDRGQIARRTVRGDRRVEARHRRFAARAIGDRATDQRDQHAPSEMRPGSQSRGEHGQRCIVPRLDHDGVIRAEHLGRRQLVRFVDGESQRPQRRRLTIRRESRTSRTEH